MQHYQSNVLFRARNVFIHCFILFSAQGDDSGKNEKVTYIILGCLSGALLITAALAAVWYWKVNKNDTERLTKKRFSVKYKYGPMKGQHGHSSSSAAP